MYSNILVPVALDHPEAAEQSLQVANKLLNDGGKVTLVTIVEEIPAYAEAHIPESTLAANKAKAEEMMQAVAASVGQPCDVAIAHGKPGPGVLNYANAQGIDLIIIASHKPGLEDYFIGSTAARVVRHAKCCVHVLR